MIEPHLDSVLEDFLQEIRERGSPDEHAMSPAGYNRIRDVLQLCSRAEGRGR
jgi:hypothetical protein